MVQVCQRWGDHCWVWITIIVEIEQQLAEQNGGFEARFDNDHRLARSIFGIQYCYFKRTIERKKHLHAIRPWAPLKFAESNSHPVKWLLIVAKSIKTWNARWHHHRRSAQNKGEEIHGCLEESSANGSKTPSWIKRRWNLNINWKAQGEIERERKVGWFWFWL